jgi:hypothetical protein
MSKRDLRRWAASVGCLTALALSGCADAGTPLGPSSAGAPKAVGVTRDYLEIPISVEAWLTGFECLDEPIYFHANGTLKISSKTSPSGVTTTSYFLQVDRPNTWLIYQGVTYHVAQGRQTGQDDVWHSVSGVQDLYVEAGVEPDFEVAETGERLRLNFSWQIVVAPDGTVRVNKVSGACPFVP